MSHYSNGYAIAIIQNGNVMETRQDGRVSIPFGSDYVIRLINRNSTRALARVAIDGQQVTEAGIVVNGHGSVDLERPCDKAVTFRFASTESKAAEEHGKGGPDTDGSKGLISVEWRPERSASYTNTYNPFTPSTWPRSSSLRGPNQASGSCCSSNPPTTMMSFAPDLERRVEVCTSTSGGIKLPNEMKSGVTVEGDYSSQQFQKVTFYVDYAVQPTMTSIKLVGFLPEEGIPRQGNRYCPACRTSTKKPTDKFCRQCGERL